MALIQERVNDARVGKNDKVICRLRSGWVVIGDVQPLAGYCLLLADPVVPSLNDLSLAERRVFLEEMTLVGDAIQAVTTARRMNYEILGNSEPELHAHILPRFDHEPDDKRKMPPFFYDWAAAPPYSEAEHGPLKVQIAQALSAYALSGDV